VEKKVWNLAMRVGMKMIIVYGGDATMGVEKTIYNRRVALFGWCKLRV